MWRKGKQGCISPIKMVKRDHLISYVYSVIGEDLLTKAALKDEIANGVQILGGKEVKKVALGVSLNAQFLKEAAAWGAIFCIVHHGFDPRTYKSKYPLFSQERLRLIFQNNMTIMGLHYVLDAHPEIGNNATIIKKLGAKIKETLFEEWGYTATFEKKRDLHDLIHECQELFEHEIFVVEAGPHEVKKIGVVSGSAKPDAEIFGEMQEKGVELFISGETSEWLPYEFEESGINYFLGGHYATEVFGVKELEKLINKEFGSKLQAKFIDIPNQI